MKPVEKEAREKRGALHLKTAEDKELMEEIGMVIVDEHTWGFKKALRQVSHLLNVSIECVDFDLRKDVYQGHLVSIRDIPEGAILEVEPAETKEEVVVETTISREVREEDPTEPSTNVVNIVNP